MAGLKEIRRKIASVLNTKKITYAMKLVSAAKLRKAQDSVGRAREYVTGLNDLLRQLVAEAGDGMSHPLLAARSEVKRVRIVAIGGSRGLCGSYNANVHRKIEAAVREISSQRPGASIEFVVVGKKPAEYCRRVGREYLAAHEKLSEDANRWPIDDICFDIERDFLSGACDEVWVIYTKFKNALSMQARFEKLLPLDPGQSAEGSAPAASSGGTIFEPSAEAVFGAVLPRILRSNFRQACLDAKASEHASRMTAMEAATRNANDLAGKLKLLANKLRQSGITRDLLDIVGGAEAIK